MMSKSNGSTPKEPGAVPPKPHTEIDQPNPAVWLWPLPTKEVDVDFLVFVERHATDLLRWDILTFFGRHPDFYGSTAEVAQNIGRRSRTIRPDLGDLAMAGVLEKVKSADGPSFYRLTPNPLLRQLVLKLAGMQLPAHAHHFG